MTENNRSIKTTPPCPTPATISSIQTFFCVAWALVSMLLRIIVQDGYLSSFELTEFTFCISSCESLSRLDLHHSVQQWYLISRRSEKLNARIESFERVTGTVVKLVVHWSSESWLKTVENAMAFKRNNEKICYSYIFAQLFTLDTPRHITNVAP